MPFQVAERGGLLHRDAEMELLPGRTLHFEQDHIGEEVIETDTYLVIERAGLRQVEHRFYLPLRIVGLPEDVKPIPGMLQVFPLYMAGDWPKHLPKHRLIDKRTRLPHPVKVTL